MGEQIMKTVTFFLLGNASDRGPVILSQTRIKFNNKCRRDSEAVNPVVAKGGDGLLSIL